MTERLVVANLAGREAWEKTCAKGEWLLVRRLRVPWQGQLVEDAGERLRQGPAVRRRWPDV